MARIDWKIWRPRLGYAAFSVLAFLVALRFTFPAEAVRERVVLEAASHGWEVNIERIRPGGGFLGLAAEGITLDDGSGPKFGIDKASASLRLLPLLWGRRSVSFDADLWNGRLKGTADLAGDTREVNVDASGIDLSRAIPLRHALGLDLVGKFTGKAFLKVPGLPQGKLSGTAEAAVSGCGIAGGSVPIPGMEGGLPVPKFALGEISAKVKIEQGKATFERLEASGGDAELASEDLYVVLMPNLAVSPVSGRLRLKLKDAFWAQSSMQSLKPIVEAAMANERTGEGAYAFQVSGSLGHPSARPPSATGPGRLGAPATP